MDFLGHLRDKDADRENKTHELNYLKNDRVIRNIDKFDKIDISRW